ncbi:MAG TPA: hypothetical protein VFV66_08890 [Nonomuraea sp.]|nr:hypothetical protein [Nonomuraea sp.]
MHGFSYVRLYRANGGVDIWSRGGVDTSVGSWIGTDNNTGGTVDLTPPLGACGVGPYSVQVSYEDYCGTQDDDLY